MPVIARPDKQQILDNIPLPMLLINRRGTIGFSNNAAENFFGRSQKKMAEMAVSALITFGDPAMVRLLDESEGDISAQDVVVIAAAGPINSDISVSILLDFPDWRMVMLSPRHGGRVHISDHDSEGSQQAMGAPAILGHEIKNPLAGIKGAAQLLERKVDDKTKPLTDLIVNEVDRIARLLDQMQNLGNSTPSNLDAANIHLVIERAIRSIRAANRALPEIMINYDPSLPDVMIDEDAMVQILINLIQNAVDSLDNKSNSVIGIGTRFVMSGELRDAGDDRKSVKLPIEVTVSDNGPGVPKHIENELFSPFVTTKREGQGLGLAIVRKLMKQMSSRIIYDRDEDKGITYFRLFLPVAGPAGRK
ncbi:nitrogen regulation protein NR(II) [Sphingorhabdus arenilitoris]|uniref:histidine kinase n=1 Tax=Sphingorhabdus arenilitoris TaxID=1490041 RepID=A0ABV8RHC7_9SPHN